MPDSVYKRFFFSEQRKPEKQFTKKKFPHKLSKMTDEHLISNLPVFGF